MGLGFTARTLTYSMHVLAGVRLLQAGPWVWVLRRRVKGFRVEGFRLGTAPTQ